MTDLKRIRDVSRNNINFIDTQAEKFSTRMESVLRDVDRDLIKLMEDFTAGKKIKKIDIEFALYARDNVGRILTESGYYDEVGGVMDAYADIPVKINDYYKLFDYQIKFNSVDKTTLTALQNLDLQFFTNLGTSTQEQIIKSIYQSTIGGRTFAQSVEVVRNTIDQLPLKKYAYTYVQTEMMGFYRQVNHVAAEKTGWDRYIYLGPDDRVTRDFCSARINKVYTREEIDKMDNGQIGTVFENGGGYNCRHDWYAVEPEYEPEN